MINEIIINPKKISIKKLFFNLQVNKLPKPDIDKEKKIMPIKKTNNSRIIIE